MTNLTLAIPEELHRKMKRHAEIRWSEVARRSISEKVEALDAMERIAAKSKLTARDVDEIASRIKRDTFDRLESEHRKRRNGAVA